MHARQQAAAKRWRGLEDPKLTAGHEHAPVGGRAVGRVEQHLVHLFARAERLVECQLADLAPKLGQNQVLDCAQQVRHRVARKYRVGDL